MKNTIILFCLLIFSNCKKTTEVNGYYYTKAKVPIPYQNVAIIDGGTGWSIATTDNNGYYHFTFKAKKKSKYKVSAPDASEKIIVGKVNNIDLYRSY